MFSGMHDCRAREAHDKEIARRLSRYDEAIQLLRRAAPAMDLISLELSERFDSFLAAEPTWKGTDE